MMESNNGCSPLGAIDRGVVIAKSSGHYDVQSLERQNITILNITAMNSKTYNVDDKVIFISFPDGTGRILDEL